MIGLVTYARYPELTGDDRPVLDSLRSRGVDARPAIWDDADERWKDFDALVLRSTRDYHLRPREFVGWLDELEADRVPLWNPASVVRWNMHKRYLRELAAAGVLIPETIWKARGDPQPLSSVMRQARWSQAIVKPAISASATSTWLTTSDTLADDLRYRELSERSDVLVQEVIPEVIAEGEWSLIYLAREFSHAMIKRPRPDDFRVQIEHGGSAWPAVPTAEVLSAGSRVASLLPGPRLYTRIDGVATPLGFMVMEVECIEPHLFLEDAKGAHDRFADAIVAAIAGSRQR